MWRLFAPARPRSAEEAAPAKSRRPSRKRSSIRRRSSGRSSAQSSRFSRRDLGEDRFLVADDDAVAAGASASASASAAAGSRDAKLDRAAENPAPPSKADADGAKSAMRASKARPAARRSVAARTSKDGARPATKDAEGGTGAARGPEEEASRRKSRKQRKSLGARLRASVKRAGPVVETTCVPLPSDKQPPTLFQSAGLFQLINFHDNIAAVAGERVFDEYLDLLSRAKTQGQLRRAVYKLLGAHNSLLREFEACLGNPPPGQGLPDAAQGASGAGDAQGEDDGADGEESANAAQPAGAAEADADDWRNRGGSVVEGLRQIGLAAGLKTTFSEVILVPRLYESSDEAPRRRGGRPAHKQRQRGGSHDGRSSPGDDDDYGDDDDAALDALGDVHIDDNDDEEDDNEKDDDDDDEPASDLEVLLAHFREALAQEPDAYEDMVDVLEDLRAGRISRDLCAQTLEERFEVTHDSLLDDLTALLDAVQDTLS